MTPSSPDTVATVEGLQPGETMTDAALGWADWCDRRGMTMLPGFLRAVATRLASPAPTAQENARHKNAEQTAFENWLDRLCPSGDVTEVQRQWVASSDYRTFCEELASPAPTPVAGVTPAVKLRFFRDLTGDERFKVLRAFGVVPDGVDLTDMNHVVEARLLERVFTHPATTTAPRLPDDVRELLGEIEQEFVALPDLAAWIRRLQDRVRRAEAELSHPVAPLSEGAARNYDGVTTHPEFGHVALTSSSGATPGLTGEAAPRNAAAPTEVEAPKGWRLVPIEPTHAMLAAAASAFSQAAASLNSINARERAYAAMLQHAPSPPVVGAATTEQDHADKA